MLSVALIAAGLFVGFAMKASAAGVLDDKDCGTAFRPAYADSPICDNALSSRKTASMIMLIVGGVTLVGGLTLSSLSRD